MIRSYLLTRATVASKWETIRDYLQDAIDQSEGQYGLCDLYNLVQDSKAQVWVSEDDNIIIGAAVTWVEPYPSGNWLTLAYGGGVIDAVKEWVPVVEKYARRLNCEGVQIYGRQGWKRELKDEGYRVDRLIMTKRLDDEDCN